MRTRCSNYPTNSNVTIPRRRRKQVSNIVEPEIRTIVAPMVERTMEELLRAPTEGYGEAIVLPEINADHFEIKTNLLQLVQANPFNGPSTSGTLPSNTILNPKGEMKAITTRSGVAYEGPSIPTNPSPKEAKIPLNENCSAMLLKKLPEKLGDPDKFLIPCNFPGMDVCHALADLGARINLMPLSIWKKLSLPELTPTRMTSSYDRSILILKDSPKSILCQRYSSTNDKSVNRIDIIDAVCEEYAPEFLGFPNSLGGNPTLTSEPFTFEFILEEIEAYLKDDSISPKIDHADFNPEEDICLIKKLLNNDPFQLPPMDLKQSEVTEAKSSIEEPLELELKDLPSHLECAFLEENDKLPVIIAKAQNLDGRIPNLCSKSKMGFNPNYSRGGLIKKEVLKLLDARMIYPISDSPWVSPVHCVPKKGGITVVANEENELILTRLVTGWRVCIDYRKLNEATRKDHFPLPFMDQMIERLAGNEFYCF
ncbi:reverse transcriptase domain-containing protein [Tanacetum coccineum]